MCSTHNEGRSIVERSIRTLNNRVQKYLTSISKIVYIDKLADIVYEYNNVYHSTIKIKSIDLKSSTHIDFGKESNEKGPKFNFNYLNIKAFLQRVTFQISLKKFLWFKKLRILCRGQILVVILMMKKLFKCFTKKNRKRQIKQKFKIEKIIKRKGDKLYVKWKVYDNSFNSSVDKKGVVIKWIIFQNHIHVTETK